VASCSLEDMYILQHFLCTGAFMFRVECGGSRLPHTLVASTKLHGIRSQQSVILILILTIVIAFDLICAIA